MAAVMVLSSYWIAAEVHTPDFHRPRAQWKECRRCRGSAPVSMGHTVAATKRTALKGGIETVRLALSLSPLRHLPHRIALEESQVAPNVIDSKNEKMSASYKARLPLTKDSHYTLHCDSWQTAKRMLT